MLSTHPKVGMAVLVGVRVKAKVRALARRDAHSFLAVRAVCCIVALCCCNFLFFLKADREGCLCRFDLTCQQRHDCPHSFLAVWAIFGIIALRCGNLFFSLESGRERDGSSPLRSF